MNQNTKIAIILTLMTIFIIYLVYIGYLSFLFPSNIVLQLLFMDSILMIFFIPSIYMIYWGIKQESNYLKSKYFLYFLTVLTVLEIMNVGLLFNLFTNLLFMFILIAISVSSSVLIGFLLGRYRLKILKTKRVFKF